MRVAVIGSGGREHALAWRLLQSPSVNAIYAIPGNDAMASFAACIPMPLEEMERIASYCVEQAIDLVIIGPEVPLAQGMADILSNIGLPVFGPYQAAAMLESSKVFAKELMKECQVPTAAFASFTDEEEAKAYIREQGAPIVIKADGLAAGKGVVVAQTVEEAIDAVHAMMKDHVFGSSGGRVVVEEYMEGEEASMLAFVDGKTIVPMIAAQDHKRIFDGDKGPNTGGMGAYAPAPVVTPAVRKAVEEQIFRPVVEGLRKKGIIYKGCLYAGLMITADGPKVVEFNCRFGDPETQAVLPLLEGDLAQIMYACAMGTLKPEMVRWKKASACCVIMASEGYPQSSHKGDVISGLDDVDSDVLVFHSGTKKTDGTFVTNGGRVLGVTAVAPDLQSAISKAYDNVQHISFAGQQIRRDIGAKGLKHLQ